MADSDSSNQYNNYDNAMLTKIFEVIYYRPRPDHNYMYISKTLRNAKRFLYLGLPAIELYRYEIINYS